MDGCKEICQRQTEMEKARRPMFQQELEELRSKVRDLYKRCARAVNVSCGGPDLEMKICYDPHSHVNFSHGGWIMSTRGHSDDPQCVANMVAEDDATTQWCDAGMQALTLQMNADESMHMNCGTQVTPEVRIRALSLSFPTLFKST